MAWHLEAVGSQGQRGTGDPKTMDLASLLYKKVADTWNADDFSKFEFPRLVKEDWPTIYKIKYNMADLLYFREQWAECGPAFDAVVQEDPKGEDAANAAYAAVLCYQNIYLAHAPEGRGQARAAEPAWRRPRHRGRLGRQVPPEGHDGRPEGDDPVVQPVRLLHPAGQGRRRRARSSSSRSSTRAAACTTRRSTGKRRRRASRRWRSTTRTTTRRPMPRSSTWRASTCSPSTGRRSGARASTT